MQSIRTSRNKIASAVVTKILLRTKVKSIIIIEHDFDDYNAWADEQKKLQSTIREYVQNSLSAQEYDITFKSSNKDDQER